MTQPIMREHKTHRDQDIKYLNQIKNFLMRKDATVISLIVIYDHIKQVCL